MSRRPLSPAPDRLVPIPRPPLALSDTDVKFAKSPPKSSTVLPAYIIRGLNDKVYDKRKQAALDIQRTTKEYVNARDSDKIDQLIYVLKHEFCYNTNGNAQKGGLIGLAGVATALAQEPGTHLDDLIPPVLGCFSDPDSRVRYYACEALYNIAKAHRGRILLFFNEIFDGLSQLAGDNDKEVRNGVELLDRLVKDIVLESTSFNIEAFIPLLKERIYVQNPFVRQFVVSWIQALDDVPDIELLDYLQEFLDGLFLILGDKNDEIRRLAENQLTEFLRQIQSSGVHYASVLQILVRHSASQDQLIQFTAITWLREFIVLAKDEMLQFQAELLDALLPALAHPLPRAREMAKGANQELMRLFERREMSHAEQDATLSRIIAVLQRHMESDDVETRVASLRWLHLFRTKQPETMFSLVDSLLPSLLVGLTDKHEKVALLAVEVLAEFADYADQGSSERVMPAQDGLYRRLMISLLQLFSEDSKLLDRRGSLIICHLCTLLSPQKVFQELADILLLQEDLDFAQHMVQTLNTILLTTVECRGLRARLKDLSKKENQELFVSLYLSWCHNPVATFSLCLLGQTYKHAADLLHLLADMEVTVGFLLQLDRLVQLLESPIFTYLRLQLLELRKYPYLGKCLYGVLMLLPQSQAYHTLKSRLHGVPAIDVSFSLNPTAEPETTSAATAIDFDSLLEYFKSVQQRRQAQEIMRR